MPQVSIIIPAYNAADTIGYTIEDILRQSFTDYELIIVNDGSKDETESVCQGYALADNRIIIINQENGGPSIARNHGVQIANSNYITFVDADDRIEEKYLEYLFKALKDNAVDMVCGRTDRVKEGFVPTGCTDEYKVYVLNQKESLREMLTGKRITVGPCHRLTPKDWYIESPFLEGKKYEDLSNTYKLHLKANSVALVDVCIYHYVMRGGSITGSKVVSARQCENYFEAISLCSNDILERYSELAQDVAVLKYRDYMSLYLLIGRCSDRNERLNDIKRDLQIWCKKNWKSAFSNSMAPLSVRLRVLLFRISPAMYKKIYYVGIRFKGKAIS